MKILIIFGAVLLFALVSAQNDPRNSKFASQMVRSDEPVNPSPSSSSSTSDSDSSAESNENIVDKIKKGLKILKTKFYSAHNCTLIPPPSLHELHEFFEWTITHNRTYGTVQEKLCRTVHLIHNLRENHEHNKLFNQGKATFKRALNHLSDLTRKEMRKKMLMKFVPQTSARSDPLTSLPPARKSVDYRNEGLVGPVGYQYECGNCWAWASAAVLEGQLRKCKISNESVSVQSMVDCAHENCDGCDGGWPYDAMKWNMNGIIPAKSYPYLDALGYCEDHTDDAIGFVETPFFHDFHYGNAEYIKRLVSAYGPVAITLCSEYDFEHYSSGVYYVEDCCTSVNHAVTIVGYGTDSKYGDYWLIKNSWDTYWGENGFGKIARGHNLCESEALVHYARVQDVRGNICQTPAE